MKLAQDSAAELLTLKDTIVIQGDDSEAAQENAARLIAIRDQLNVDRKTVETAEKNLSTLMGMNQNLAGKSEEVVTAVQTLEILNDFRTEVSRQVASLQDIRRSLMEISLLETSVGRAVRILEPLVNIGNLRRLSEDEVRAAARAVLNARSTRLGQRTERHQTAKPDPGHRRETRSRPRALPGGCQLNPPCRPKNPGGRRPRTENISFNHLSAPGEAQLRASPFRLGWQARRFAKGLIFRRPRLRNHRPNKSHQETGSKSDTQPQQQRAIIERNIFPPRKGRDIP